MMNSQDAFISDIYNTEVPELNLEQEAYLTTLKFFNKGGIPKEKVRVGALIEKRFSLPQIYNYLNIKDLKSLFEIGFSRPYIYNRDFIQSVEYLLVYGIDRKFIMECDRSKWPKVMTPSKSSVIIHPVEALSNRGYTMEELKKLGWRNLKCYEDDGVPPYVVQNMITKTVSLGIETKYIQDKILEMRGMDIKTYMSVHNNKKNFY